MLRLVVCALSLAAPAQLLVVESIFEHGIEAKGNAIKRVYQIPAGTCNFTLYPSNLVCDPHNPHPHWLHIRVVDLRLAWMSISSDMLEVKIQRTVPARYDGRCFTVAKLYLTAKCGRMHVHKFHTWGLDLINK